MNNACWLDFKNLLSHIIFLGLIWHTNDIYYPPEELLINETNTELLQSLHFAMIFLYIIKLEEVNMISQIPSTASVIKYKKYLC